MTPPTPEELLRLARKAWPLATDLETIATAAEDHMHVNSEMLGPLLSARYAPRAREALHAALLVLSGEIDVAELLAERDRLRDGLKREIAGAFVGGEVVYVSGLKLLLEDNDQR